MEERRLKEVDEGESDVDAGSGVRGESGELELRLSLGRRGCGSGSLSHCGRICWLSPADLTVGSSCCTEELASGSRWGQRDDLVIPGDMDGVGIGVPKFHAVETSSGDGGNRNAQHKRAKVVLYDEIAMLSAIGKYKDLQTFSKAENQMIDYFHSNLNAHDDGSPIEDTSVHDESDNATSIVDDSENRMDLTEDLLHLVFSFLSQRDLCKAGATCKQWKVASMHEDFWKHLNFKDTELSLANFETICQRYPNANMVNLSGVPQAHLLVMEAMTSLRRLNSLFLGKAVLGDSFFHSLTDCPALNNLHIYDASLGNGVQEISVCHDRLIELNILKCRVLRISIRCPQLQTLALRRTSMAHVLLSCPQLRKLDIASCHKLSDAGIRVAAASCPLLTSLDLAFCSCVSDETLREVASSCPNLCVLDASYCPNISLESVRLPMLIDLKLDNCEGITSASVSAIGYSGMLQALQLDNCSLLTSVSLDLPHLRSISLVHCRKFLDLKLRSSVLSYVKVSNCSLLQRISIVSNVLKKLVLQKQESLANLLLQCNNLQEVDLSDCESLTNSVCEVFSDGGGCPMLKLLILDNCESLTMVRLNNSSLVNLSLVGCHAMNVLKLSCPNLLKINLDGCDHLQEASFCPVGLESLNLGICPKLSILHIEAFRMSVLELKGCGMLSKAFINCPNLVSLDASFCRKFMDNSLLNTAASCHNIETLILTSCLSVGFDGLSSLHWLQRLTLLDLSYTFLMNLQPIFDSCCQLVILRLSACKYLTDRSLEPLYNNGALPMLRELDLSYSSIGQSAISDLLARCTNLVNVNLNGCVYMHELMWDSSGHHSSGMLASINGGVIQRKSEHLLEVLNCIGCPYIKNVAIPWTACCVHLAKLNLNLSMNLKRVDLACPNLNNLNLSNCSLLEILRLDCPRLIILQLSGCIMLSQTEVWTAVSGCGMLETLNVHSCTKIHANILRLRMVCPSLKRILSNPSV